MKTFKLLGLAAAVGMALASGQAAASAIVAINPDAAGVDPLIQVGSLGWGNGNALVTPVSGSVINPVQGDVYQVYAHARLDTFYDETGTQIGGLNLNGPSAATNYEWTYVMAFRETVTGAAIVSPGTGTVTLQTIAGGTNFFNVYYDPTPDGVNLAGTGFGPVGATDDILILSGLVAPYDPVTATGTTTFTATGVNTGDPDLDNFLTDNYPAVDSTTGTGSGDLQIDVTFANLAYFPGGVPSVITLNFDTFLNQPFAQTDPSSCFWNNGVLINGVGPNTNGGPCQVNTVGAFNGITGPNQVIQSRSTNNFERVPEPSSIALLGLGLSAFGFSMRKRRVG